MATFKQVKDALARAATRHGRSITPIDRNGMPAGVADMPAPKPVPAPCACGHNPSADMAGTRNLLRRAEKR